MLETFHAEIDTLLGTNSGNIMSVILRYKQSGKTVYQIVKEPGFFTRMTHPYTFLGNYSYTLDSDVAIFIGRGDDCIYFKLVSKQESRERERDKDD